MIFSNKFYGCLNQFHGLSDNINASSTIFIAFGTIFVIFQPILFIFEQLPITFNNFINFFEVLKKKVKFVWGKRNRLKPLEGHIQAIKSEQYFFFTNIQIQVG